jgi:hypothetical protein
MKIAAELEELRKTYAAITEELGKAFGAVSAEKIEAAARAVLVNRECLSRIEQLSARVFQISAAWQKYAQMDPGSEDEANHSIAAAKVEALRLKEICDAHIQKLITIRTRILRDMADLSKGTRLLQSLRPVKGNYPKFIDSTF